VAAAIRVDMASCSGSLSKSWRNAVSNTKCAPTNQDVSTNANMAPTLWSIRMLSGTGE